MSSTAGSTDFVRLQGACRWERDAFFQLVMQYNPMIRRIGRKYLGANDWDIDDYSQQVWREVAERLLTFEYDPDRIRFRVWLGNLAKFRAIDTYRKRGLEPPSLSLEADPIAADSDPADLSEPSPLILAKLQRAQRVQEAARRRVKPSSWEAFQLRVVEGLSFHEVAERQGIDYPTAFRRNERVLRTLKEEAARLSDPGDAAPPAPPYMN